MLSISSHRYFWKYCIWKSSHNYKPMSSGISLLQESPCNSVWSYTGCRCSVISRGRNRWQQRSERGRLEGRVITPEKSCCLHHPWNLCLQLFIYKCVGLYGVLYCIVFGHCLLISFKTCKILIREEILEVKCMTLMYRFGCGFTIHAYCTADILYARVDSQ